MIALKYGAPFSAITLKRRGAAIEGYGWTPEENSQGFFVLRDAIGCCLDNDEDYDVFVVSSLPQIEESSFSVAIPFEFTAEGMETRDGWSESDNFVISTGESGNQVTFVVMANNILYIVLEQVSSPSLRVLRPNAGYPVTDNFVVNATKTAHEVYADIPVSSAPDDSNALRKFELTNICKPASMGDGLVFRIRAVRGISDFVQAGELGGWVSTEANLSHTGYCWISGEAEVTGCALVSENAQVSGCVLVASASQIKGCSNIDGDIIVTNESLIDGNTCVTGSGTLDNARIGFWFEGEVSIVLNNGAIERE